MHNRIQTENLLFFLQKTDGKDAGNSVKTVIIDASSIGFIDIMGVNAIKDVSETLNAANISLIIADCNCKLLFLHKKYQSQKF